ncbi:MAG: Fic family protein [Myxococcales bacterium]|nr:Fic family protein [Myxococcales bacterium]
MRDIPRAGNLRMAAAYDPPIPTGGGKLSRHGETVRMGLRNSFRDIDDRTDDLRDLAGEHPDIWETFWHHYDMSWLYHENALEGVVVTHAELSSALQGRPISPDTYHDIRNLRRAVEVVRSEANTPRPASRELLCRVHSLLLTGRPTEDYRYLDSVLRKDIPLHRAYFHEISPPERIRDRLQQLLVWAGTHDPDDDDAIRFAAHFHHEFMRIFPFAKHSGKTGRLLVNYILARHGYMPVIFHATERQRYYDTLRLSRKDMEALLTDMMTNCVENGLRYVRHVLTQRAKKDASRSPTPARAIALV